MNIVAILFWGLKNNINSPSIFLAAVGSWVLILLLIPCVLMVIGGVIDKNNRIWGMTWSGLLLGGTIIIALIL